MKVELGPYSKKDEPRIEEIEIHDYDIWNMDQTLAMIILPMLRMLKDNCHSYPSNFAEPDWGENDGVPINYGGNGGGLKKWHETLDKMIVGFELLNLDDWPTHRAGDSTVVQEATELFGRYYQNLWD